MREVNLNGYIDEDVWYGDEITPDALHKALYGAENQYADDVHIRLNSYGGSCNAATRMFDDIRAYPGNVSVTISGTAASAATVLAMAANHLEMTPGSLFMIHDPSTLALGNEKDLQEAIRMLKACKESILNCYATRCRLDRSVVSAMMTAVTWMDATAAMQHGFVDTVSDGTAGMTNAEGCHAVNRRDAEAKVQAWLNRHKPQMARPGSGDHPTPSAVSTENQLEQNNATPVVQLRKRLDLIKPIR